MKILLLLIGFCLTLISCNDHKLTKKKKIFNQFDFSYNDFFSTCFSIKFTQGDTVFIRQHFAHFSDTLKSDQDYFAILNNIERQKLDSFLNKVSFASYDTSYYQSYEDGGYFQFYISNDTLQKTVFVHSDSIPTELKEFGYWITAMKKKLKLHLADATSEFGSLEHFLPPSVPPPSIEFTPPKVE